MAAAQQNRNQREVVEFPPNIPITVALKYGQGKIVSGMSGERVMYSLMDGRVMFLAPEVAGQIEELGVNVRENFTLTKKWDGQKGSLMTWEVARAVGEQPNGTLVIPKPPASAATPEAPRANPLVTEAKALVDAYAEVLEYGLTTYQGRVKPDEIRGLTISAYIQRRQLSSCA